jgi:hypothetical protein
MSEAKYSAEPAEFTRLHRDGRSFRELFEAELALHGITWCRGAGMDSDQLRRVMRDLGDAVNAYHEIAPAGQDIRQLTDPTNGVPARPLEGLSVWPRGAPSRCTMSASALRGARTSISTAWWHSPVVPRPDGCPLRARPAGHHPARRRALHRRGDPRG